MSVATVKAHVSRVLAKLGLHNRVQIALSTYGAGLLDEAQDRAGRADGEERERGGH